MAPRPYTTLPRCVRTKDPVPGISWHQAEDIRGIDLNRMSIVEGVSLADCGGDGSDHRGQPSSDQHAYPTSANNLVLPGRDRQSDDIFRISSIS